MAESKAGAMMSKELKWLMLCGSLALGEALGFSLARFGACAPIAAFLTIIVVLFGLGAKSKTWLFSGLFFLGLTLSLLTSHEKNCILNEAIGKSEPYVADVVVSSVPFRQKATGKAGTDKITIPSQLGPVKVRVVYHVPENSESPRIGERLRVTGWLSRKTLPNRDIHMFWVPDGKIPQRLPITLWGYLAGLVQGLREDLSFRAGIGLEHDPLAMSLNRAILLGERSSLDPLVRNDFVSAGTIHLFAISGLHVMFIAFFLQTLLVLAGCPLRMIGILLIPLLWVYAWVTGFPPSAVRATLMATFYFSAPICWRRPNGIVSWAITFLIVHLLSPNQLNDVGCRLSFTVMLAILTWVRWGVKFRAPWKDSLMVTSVAWMAGVPITARVFERFTIGGLLVNPILVAVAGMSVTLGILGCFTGYVSFAVASHFNNAAALCTRFMAGVSSMIAGLPGSTFEIAPWTPFMCAAWYVASFMIVWLVRYHAKIRSRII